jgi:hypothetical protein
VVVERAFGERLRRVGGRGDLEDGLEDVDVVWGVFRCEKCDSGHVERPPPPPPAIERTIFRNFLRG